jgi:lipoprotein NlpD
MGRSRALGGAHGEKLRMDARAAVGLLCVCCLPLAGCETAPAPVAERRVEDYRKAGPAPAAAPKQTPAATSVTAPAPPPPAGPKPAAPKPAPAGEEAAEPDSRPEFYTVKRGDTLYSVALDAGLDYKELAAWNQLDDPNVIRVGQQLRLRPPPGWKPESADTQTVIVRPAATQPQVESLPLDVPPPVKSGPKGIKAPYSEQALAQLTRDPGKVPAIEGKPAAEVKPQARPQSSPTPAAPPTASSTSEPAPMLAKPATSPVAATRASEPAAGPERQESLQWVWPTAGQLLHPFDDGPNPKGVAIAGNPGQAIVASAAGKVVYSGSALRGYGKLIIIKHDNTYLSVYAHNRELLVKEGEHVSKGQRIAEMGSIDSEQIGLHFEIRRMGKPVDPLKYLPPQGSP